jgi:hypothetical protein
MLSCRLGSYSGRRPTGECIAVGAVCACGRCGEAFRAGRRAEGQVTWMTGEARACVARAMAHLLYADCLTPLLVRLLV